MKKIFFIAGIFSAGCAVAQQKDVFDIDKHLKDHQPTNLYSFLKPGYGTYSEPFLTKALYRFHSLTQDNMPCIVPDMHQFNMPVVTGKTAFPLSPSSPGAMPNPALPSFPFQ